MIMIMIMIVILESIPSSDSSCSLAETKGQNQREDEGVARAHPSCQQGRIKICDS